MSPNLKQPKRLILLLDGTWNDADFKAFDTNVVRLKNRISEFIEKQGAVAGARRNLVFYERGVGTGPSLDPWLGGVLGAGLTKNIRRAYRFLSANYEPSDEVFIFGFSRGAYTARSLVGYIEAVGLLRPQFCTEDNEIDSWDYYRVPLADRSPGTWINFSKEVHDRSVFKIDCLGLFDTVGALGVPLRSWRAANREKYEFHSVSLSGIVSLNLHALAIDERRSAFEASVWRRPLYPSPGQHTEQVWFPGAHADIGGGYVEDDDRKGETAESYFLDDLPLHWMINRVKEKFADFPIERSNLSVANLNEAAAAPQHNSRAGIYRFQRPAFRSLANSTLLAPYDRVANLWPLSEPIGHDRHASAYNEMIHISALARFNQEIITRDAWRDRLRRYNPPNLVPWIEKIAEAYSAVASKNPKIEVETLSNVPRIVDWTGEPIEFGSNEATDLIRKFGWDNWVRA